MSEQHQEQNTQEPEGAQEQHQENEAEAKARESGWVPLAEYKGTPERHKSAEEWLEREPRKYIPKLETKITELEKTIAGHSDTVRRLERMGEVAVQRARQQVIDEYEAKVEKAVELGDTEALKAAKKVQTDALKKIDEDAAADAKKTKTDDGISPEAKAQAEAWAKENSWFTTDPKLNRYARTVYDDVAEDMPGASETDRLAEVKARVAKMFPEKFGRGNGLSRVEGGPRTSSGNGVSRGWSSLPDDAKTAGRKQIAQGLFKDEKDYATEYWKEVGDQA